MQKIVIDTNVLVSALLTKGYSSKIIYELVLAKKVKLCLSPSILKDFQIAEYKTVKIVSPKECWDKFNSPDSPPSYFAEPRAHYRKKK